jgi:hypothetical protein
MRVLSKLQNLCFFFISTFNAFNKECIFERKFLNFLKNKTDAMYVKGDYQANFEILFIHI